MCVRIAIRTMKKNGTRIICNCLIPMDESLRVRYARNLNMCWCEPTKYCRWDKINSFSGSIFTIDSEPVRLIDSISHECPSILRLRNEKKMKSLSITTNYTHAHKRNLLVASGTTNGHIYRRNSFFSILPYTECTPSRLWNEWSHHTNRIS